MKSKCRTFQEWLDKVPAIFHATFAHTLPATETTVATVEADFRAHLADIQRSADQFAAINGVRHADHH